MKPDAAMTARGNSTSQIPEILPGVIGISPRMRAAAERVSLIAETDATCLLTGETGTGKELFARGIHYLSARKHGPFVPVNCGAVPDQLFENELFGHVRGAYTDARSDERGLVAYAEGGTLFLDEVDALSPNGQVKLLRVLQEREYRPVGSARMVPANIRIVAATNSNLYQSVHSHRFREDLYFRLNILSLTIPPLRERLDDIPSLAAYYIREYALTYSKPVQHIESPAIDRLMGYHWPGNVRELQAVLQRAVLTTRGLSVAASDLDLPGSAAVAEGHLTLKAAKTVAVAHCERSYLCTVLQRCQGNVTQAAKMAGKERRSFQRLLRKYAITVNPFKSGADILDSQPSLS
jgi:transcriptional regulator with PAS, ATPase and Fis domain